MNRTILLLGNISVVVGLAGMVGLSAAAVFLGDDSQAETDVSAAPAPPTTAAAVTSPPTTEAAPADTPSTDLSGVCPDPLVVQTDWFPESEHGAMYELLGGDYIVDAETKAVRGSMTLDGQDLGIVWEVRTGGPAIGFSPPSQWMIADDSIHFGYAATDQQIEHWNEAPLMSVVATLEINPQMIMWDPQTYPDIETIADIGAAGITVNVFAGWTFPEVLIGQGIWSRDQVDPSYNGSPTQFVAAGGAIAQQGFASSEPYTYEEALGEILGEDGQPMWGKPVAFDLLHNTGFQVYAQTLGIRPGDLEQMRPCLEKVVPIVQRAVVSYMTDPERANAIIVDAVQQFEDFWVYAPGNADYGVRTMRELGLVGNGPDNIVGNMEEARIAQVLYDMRSANEMSVTVDWEIPEDLTADQLFTNEFIDPSIGF